MSGPQGPDPTQPWQPPQGEGQQSGEDHTQHVSPWQQSSGDQGWQAAGGEQQTWQAPAYTPTEYGQYQQPPTQYYPPSQSYPQGYPQQDQYGGQTAAYAAAAGPVRPAPAGPVRPAGSVRSAGPVRATRSVPGQPGQYGQYPGAYGQPPAGPKRSRAMVGSVRRRVRRRRRRGVLVLGFWAPGFFVTTKLDVSKAEAGVQQILSDSTNGYGAKNVKDVKCNNGQNPTVKKGASFDCDVSIDGTKRSVTVTFQDNKGTYEVGRPK